MNQTIDVVTGMSPLADFPPELQSQIQDLLSQTVSLTISQLNISLLPIVSTFAAFGYFIGDWASSLAEEAALLKQIFRGKAKPAHCFYFLARLCGFVFILLLLLFNTLGRKPQDDFNCSAVPKIFWTFNIVALGAAYSLLALRCSALLGKKPMFTYAIYAAATLTVLSYIPGYIGISGDQTFTGFISCTLYPIKKYVAVSYLISFFYDTMITALSIIGLLSSTRSRNGTLRGPNASFVRRIILGNSIYFAVLLIISLGSGLVPLVDMHPDAGGAIAVLAGPHTVLTICMSLKIFRYLRSSVLNPAKPTPPGMQEAPREDRHFNPSGKASFASNTSPVYKISRSEEIDMRAFDDKSDRSDDLEKAGFAL